MKTNNIRKILSIAIFIGATIALMKNSNHLVMKTSAAPGDVSPQIVYQCNGGADANIIQFRTCPDVFYTNDNETCMSAAIRMQCYQAGLGDSSACQHYYTYYCPGRHTFGYGCEENMDGPHNSCRFNENLCGIQQCDCIQYNGQHRHVASRDQLNGCYVPTPAPTQPPVQTPAPTPWPTPNPTSAPTPTPIEIIVPTNTPVPTPTTIPTPIATPTVTPTITPSPTPEIILVPTDTPVPTPSGTPSPTDVPTPTPTDTVSPAPTGTPAPTPVGEEDTSRRVITPTATATPAPTTETPSNSGTGSAGRIGDSLIGAILGSSEGRVLGANNLAPTGTNLNIVLIASLLTLTFPLAYIFKKFI